MPSQVKPELGTGKPADTVNPVAVSSMLCHRHDHFEPVLALLF